MGDCQTAKLPMHMIYNMKSWLPSRICTVPGFCDHELRPHDLCFDLQSMNYAVCFLAHPVLLFKRVSGFRDCLNEFAHDLSDLSVLTLFCSFVAARSCSIVP